MQGEEAGKMFDDLIENNLISKYMVDSTTESDAGEND